jgi:L-rhamnose-H+ transport protein
MAILEGVILVLAGVGVCAVAGRMREKVLGIAGAPAQLSMIRGLLFCLIAGVGSALVGLGLTYGQPIRMVAEQFGATGATGNNAIWLPLMVAGGIPNLLYTFYLLRKNGTGARFSIEGTGRYWILAGLMALFWFGSTVLYGVAAVTLGDLGPILAWPLFMSLIVISANLWGVGTGEWRGAGRKPLAIMGTGVMVLVVAIVVLARASRL